MYTTLCAFRALPRIIAEILLAAPKSSEICIVSPWIRDVLLKPPIIVGTGGVSSQRRTPLSQFLHLLVSRRDVHLHIFVRKFDHDIRNVTAKVRGSFPDSVYIHQAPHLHAKVIATSNTVLQMSANLIPTSLYRNIETCAISTNRYSSARNYTQNELKLGF